jgi:hypothetical protein
LFPSIDGADAPAQSSKQFLAAADAGVTKSSLLGDTFIAARARVICDFERA